MKHSAPEEEEPFLSTPKPVKSRNHVTYLILVALVISALINIILVLPPDLDATCLRHTSSHASPITDDISIRYESVDYDGKFFNSTVYRLPPGQEVDNAWLDLGTRSKVSNIHRKYFADLPDRHYIIPEDRAERYGINPGATKVIPEQGGGFPVLFEFDHHLHCLNLLRMSFWFNYPYYHTLGEGPFGDDPEILKTHTTHCLDILRQFIMCNADIGVYGQFWVKDLDRPFVDFNTKHTCKDFGALKKWVGDHQAGDVRVAFREGDVLLDTTP